MAESHGMDIQIYIQFKCVSQVSGVFIGNIFGMCVAFYKSDTSGDTHRTASVPHTAWSGGAGLSGLHRKYGPRCIILGDRQRAEKEVRDMKDIGWRDLEDRSSNTARSPYHTPKRRQMEGVEVRMLTYASVKLVPCRSRIRPLRGEICSQCLRVVHRRARDPFGSGNLLKKEEGSSTYAANKEGYIYMRPLSRCAGSGHQRRYVASPSFRIEDDGMPVSNVVGKGVLTPTRGSVVRVQRRFGLGDQRKVGQLERERASMKGTTERRKVNESSAKDLAKGGGNWEDSEEQQPINSDITASKAHAFLACSIFTTFLESRVSLPGSRWHPKTVVNRDCAGGRNGTGERGVRPSAPGSGSEGSQAL
ncbi:hypothetical protein B0H11DRAFT_1939401 [Mycena galericulata]|nr:hypothetical protein B0H11DRAFT_1939401 [Mycena galericulata]